MATPPPTMATPPPTAGAPPPTAYTPPPVQPPVATAVPLAPEAPLKPTTPAPSRAIQIAKGILYALCFTFGVMMWGVTAGVILGNNYSIDGNDLNFPSDPACAVFNLVYDSATDATPPAQGTLGYEITVGGRTLIFGSSSICTAIIALGVILTLVLLAAVIWNSLGACNVPCMPPLIEAIAFAVMSLVWFILGIVAVAAVPGFLKGELQALKTCAAGGWLAGFSHLAVGILAFVQWRKGRGSSKIDTSPVQTAPPVSPPLQPGAIPLQQPVPPVYSAPQPTAYSPPPQTSVPVYTPPAQPVYPPVSQPVQLGVPPPPTQ